MSERGQYDSQHEATLAEWRRKRELDKDKAEFSEESLRKSLASALKAKRSGVARDLKAATENRATYDKGQGGFGVYDDGEIITGYGDAYYKGSDDGFDDE